MGFIFMHNCDICVCWCTEWYYDHFNCFHISVLQLLQLQWFTWSSGLEDELSTPLLILLEDELSTPLLILLDATRCVANITVVLYQEPLCEMGWQERMPQLSGLLCQLCCGSSVGEFSLSEVSDPLIFIWWYYAFNVFRFQPQPFKTHSWQAYVSSWCWLMVHTGMPWVQVPPCA